MLKAGCDENNGMEKIIILTRIADVTFDRKECALLIHVSELDPADQKR